MAEAQQGTVSEDELERLLRSDVRSLGRDPVALRSLLDRMSVTVREHNRTVRRLQGAVEMAAANTRAGSSPLATAVEALGRLSVEEQRQVFDVHASAALERLREATAEAHRVKLAARSEANRVRLSLAQVEADPTLPAAAREALAAHLAALPTTHPEVLEAPESSPLPHDRPVFTVPARPADPAATPAPSLGHGPAGVGAGSAAPGPVSDLTGLFE